MAGPFMFRLPTRDARLVSRSFEMRRISFFEGSSVVVAGLIRSPKPSYLGAPAPNAGLGERKEGLAGHGPDVLDMSSPGMTMAPGGADNWGEDGVTGPAAISRPACREKTPSSHISL
ncbi:hypothetical protein NP493_29g07008 [Ridgeia piscesae]|uniref:Uncharacterized protein n=1 Tax=Ridgeia piscesae TaxID=27915 RepID=A0AAD9PCY7_RIDPI|nr:hypothetical protein NP493_29g07008 [Ridgeia piscesae]